MGWPFTVLFGLLQAAALWPIFGIWSLLFTLFIMAGEPTGWKPKLIWDNGDWKGASILGARIGLIGALAVPLSVWMEKIIPEPQINALQNPRKFKLPFWSKPKSLLDWRGAWDEVYFGLVFRIILQVGVLTYGSY
jgi:hypothetical protein